MEFTFVMDFSISVLDRLALDSHYAAKKGAQLGIWLAIIIALGAGGSGVLAMYKILKNK